MKKEYREIYGSLYRVYYMLRQAKTEEKVIREIHKIQHNVGKLLENENKF
jgi:hypothetical protein